MVILINRPLNHHAVMLRNLGRSLLYLRKQEGYTQQQVADLLFVSRSTYASWEAGKSDITFSKLLLLITTYHISITEFMTLTDIRHQHNYSRADTMLHEMMKKLEQIETLLHQQNLVAGNRQH